MSALSLSLSSLALLTLSGVAYAGDPVADTWFATDHDFSSDDCDPDGTDMCSLNTSTGRVECKADRHSGGEGAVMAMIRNESDVSETDICNGYEFCGFGAIKTGVSTEEFFYCQWDGSDIKKMSITGSGYADYLYFHHSQNGEFDLEEHDGVDNLTGYIYALGAADEVHGSRHAGADYADVLSAGDGDDISWGHDGDDEMHLGDGDDIAWAGPGNDTINMDAGTNEASGEDGNDIFVGGTGSDRGHGGDHDDTMDGHEDQDFFCGGDGDDTLDMGSGNGDEAWGGNGTDSADGGPGTGDQCDAESTTNCTGLAFEPTECPDEHEGA